MSDETLTLGATITALKQDETMRAKRVGWGETALEIGVRSNEAGQSYIFTNAIFGVYVPWVVSFEDVFADDWLVYPYEES
jgi:hypothetical protein